MKQWYVVQTITNQEFNVERRIEQRHEFFMPRAYANRRISNNWEKKGKTVPLLPNYGFIRLTQGIDDFHAIIATEGVTGMIRQEKNGYKCPNPIYRGDEVIQHIKDRQNSQGVVMTLHDYKVDDPILVKDGAFEGQLSKITSIRGEDRLVAFMSILGRQVPVEFNYKQVESA